MLFELLLAHAITDFALQPIDMGIGKNRHKKPKHVPLGVRAKTVWFYYLTAHALVNGAGVYLVIGSRAFGIIETIVHWLLDFCKCEGWINPHRDQLFHVMSKIIYCLILGSI